MSIQDFNTVRRLRMRDFIGNDDNIKLLRQYIDHYCDDYIAAGLERALHRLTQAS